MRRRVLEGLAAQPWTAIALAEHINAGEATVFEVIRALKAIGGVDRIAGSRGSYQLSAAGIGEALRALIDAAKPFDEHAVSRPPGRVIRQ